MTVSKQPKSGTSDKIKKPFDNSTELTDAALNQASGGAIDGYMPTDQTVAMGGGGAGKTDGALIALLRTGKQG